MRRRDNMQQNRRMAPLVAPFREREKLVVDGFHKCSMLMDSISEGYLLLSVHLARAQWNEITPSNLTQVASSETALVGFSGSIQQGFGTLWLDSARGNFAWGANTLLMIAHTFHIVLIVPLKELNQIASLTSALPSRPMAASSITTRFHAA